jgi:hypothetical protein
MKLWNCSVIGAKDLELCFAVLLSIEELNNRVSHHGTIRPCKGLNMFRKAGQSLLHNLKEQTSYFLKIFSFPLFCCSQVFILPIHIQNVR